MEEQNDILEELWKVKRELSSQFETFHDFFESLLKYQKTQEWVTPSTSTN